MKRGMLSKITLCTLLTTTIFMAGSGGVLTQALEGDSTVDMRQAALQNKASSASIPTSGNSSLWSNMPLKPGSIKPKGEMPVEVPLQDVIKSEMQVQNKVIDNMTTADKALVLTKTQEAVKAYNNANLNQTSVNLLSVGWTTLLRYNYSTTPEMQKWPTWCGPAAAINAIDTRAYHSTGKITAYTQDQLAAWLNTSMIGGTNFDTSLWTKAMNYHAPGNNYIANLGGNYSNWQDVMSADIIYTLNRGYPVIADCKMNKDNGFIFGNYERSYNENPRNIFHYIPIIGYGYENGQLYFRYLDSCSYSYGAYNVSASALARVTKEFGIIW